MPAVAAQASQPAPVSQTAAVLQKLTLNSHYNWRKHYTPPVSTDFKLKKHYYYVATVSGTFSFYARMRYLDPSQPWPVVCGTPDSSSLGPVGFDAEFIFARPWRSTKCKRAHLPEHWSNFQVDTSGLDSFSHPLLLGNWPTAPNPEHTYGYALAGSNAVARFRLFDKDTADNYGSLAISLRLATTADCLSYAAFRFASESECLAKIAG